MSIQRISLCLTTHRRNLGGTKGTGTPTFWTGGIVPPLFMIQAGEEFAVIGDLRRLNYTKTVFGGGTLTSREFTTRLGACLRGSHSPLLNGYIGRTPTF